MVRTKVKKHCVYYTVKLHRETLEIMCDLNEGCENSSEGNKELCSLQQGQVEVRLHFYVVLCFLFFTSNKVGILLAECFYILNILLTIIEIKLIHFTSSDP